MNFQKRIESGWKLRFFIIWIGQAFSLFGSGIVDFALIWWLTDVTGSEQVLVIGNLVALLPRMVLGPFAGTLIDRADKKRVMILADGAIALVTLGLMAAAAFGWLSAALVLFVLFLRSMGGMFHQPAMKSATAILFPADQQARIGGFNRVLTGAMTIISPVAGALFLELLPMAAVLAVDVVTAALAITSLLPIRMPPAHEKTELSAGDVLRETWDGLRYVWDSRSLKYVVFTCTAVNIGVGPCAALKSMLVKSVFSGGAAELSVITSAEGAGLLLGGIIMGLWGGFRRNLLTSGLGWGLVGLSYFGISVLAGDQFVLLAAFFLASGIAMAIGCAGLDAYYMNAVPEAYHGRVFSVLATLDNTTVPLGLIIAAVTGGLIRIQTWYLITGILHFGLFVFWLFSRRIRKAEEGRE